MSPRRRFILARTAYLVIVLVGTLTNLHASSDLHAVHDRLLRAITPSLTWRDAIDGLRNVVLFAGLGAVWVVTSLTGHARREIVYAAIVSLLLSTMVEALQLFSPVRDASIVDVTTNTLGGIAGAVATVALLTMVQAARREKSYLGVPMLVIAGPYAVAALCEALAPLFHSAPLPNVHGGPLTRLQLVLGAALPLSWGEVPVLDLALFGAAGFLLVALVRERATRPKGDWLWVGGAGAAIVAAAHVVHGAYSLAVRGEALAVDALSLVLGAWAASQSLAPLTQRYRGAARARVAIMSYIGLLALWGWRPLLPKSGLDEIANQLNPVAFTPLASLAERVDVFSALHVVQQFVLYVPLGALLAVWPLRSSGKLAHLWPGVWIAAVIELGHIVMAGRTFDATNFLLALAGLAIGWVGVRRCGYAAYGVAMPGA